MSDARASERAPVPSENYLASPECLEILAYIGYTRVRHGCTERTALRQSTFRQNKPWLFYYWKTRLPNAKGLPLAMRGACGKHRSIFCSNVSHQASKCDMAEVSTHTGGCWESPHSVVSQKKTLIYAGNH